MANTKISQLPEYTGNTYNGYVVWNDSGETTTYKTKQTNSYVKRLEVKDLTETNTINTNNKASLVLGKNNTIGRSGISQLFMGDDNTTTSSSPVQTGANLIVGNQNSISGNLSMNMGIFGNSNSISGGWGLRFGNNGNCRALGFLSAGEQSVIDTNANYVISWGDYQTIQTSNTISIGDNCDVTGTGDYNAILAGKNNLITGGGSIGNAIIGASGTTISAKTNTIVIGLNNFTGATQNNTTYVNHLTSVGQMNNGYYDNLSGDTFTIDWNNGNSQKVYMTGATTLDFTNVRNGATYKLQVVNGGTHSITGATASGYSILCEGGAIPNITNNGVDLCILEVMGTDILVRHFADFSTP